MAQGLEGGLGGRLEGRLGDRLGGGLQKEGTLNRTLKGNCC